MVITTKVHWNDYNFKHPFDMVGAAYVAGESVWAYLTSLDAWSKVRVVKASSDDLDRLTVTLGDDPREVTLNRDDVHWACKVL